ncbi:uncharacterized protein LOC110341105 [Mesocricetus auratus]|uniref:Uncharacterized protein LOC110341105 n=1 Tax=Mesocricetus auratus TaxID=10036 RepID=A0A3Q0CS64_MESAU|nr:uncharacterized protein LOC110341105 [Mesocricetus auratus]
MVACRLPCPALMIMDQTSETEYRTSQSQGWFSMNGQQDDERETEKGKWCHPSMEITISVPFLGEASEIVLMPRRLRPLHVRTPEETTERLVCTQKLCGARGRTMNTCVYSSFHGKFTSATTTSCVVSGWLKPAGYHQGSGCPKTTGRGAIESLFFVPLMDDPKMRNHRKRKTDLVSYLGWEENRDASLCHILLHLLAPMELPSSHCFPPCLQA